MRRSACFGVQVSHRWLRATACLLACAWAAAPAVAQQEPAEPVVLALGPASPADAGKPQAGLSLDVRPSLSAGDPAPNSTDVGLTWRQPLGAQHLVDITAWRRNTPQFDALSLIQQRDPAVFGARFEFKLGAKRNFATDHRFIGLQLDSGARIGIRRNNGNPVLYYRAQF